MKRGTYIILIALAIGLIAAGAVLAVRDRIADAMHITETAPPEIYTDNACFDAAGTKSIRAELGSADLHIYAAFDDMISVEVDGNAEISVRREDGVLTIRESEENGVSLFSPGENQVVIWLPAGYEGELRAALASGEVNVNGLDLPGLDMDIATASGEIRLYSCFLGGLSLASASGDLWIGEDVLSGSLSVTSVSGELSAYEVTAADVNVYTVSGDVWMDGTAAGVSVDTTSGDVSLTLPGAAAGYDLHCSTASGRVTGADGAVGGSVSVSVSTLSGDISIAFEDDEG